MVTFLSDFQFSTQECRWKVEEKGMEEDGESNCFVAGDHWGRRGKKKDDSVC